MYFIFLLDEENPLALVLKAKLTNWEFGTALVNCVEEWFLFNPNLGFKNAAKNIFRFALFSIREGILHRIVWSLFVLTR